MVVTYTLYIRGLPNSYIPLSSVVLALGESTVSIHSAYCPQNQPQVPSFLLTTDAFSTPFDSIVLIRTPVFLQGIRRIYRAPESKPVLNSGCRKISGGIKTWPQISHGNQVEGRFLESVPRPLISALVANQQRWVKGKCTGFN